MNPGVWVTFAGIDAAGKDTISRSCAERLSMLEDCAVAQLTKRSLPSNENHAVYLEMVSKVAFPHIPDEQTASIPPDYWILQAAQWYKAFHASVISPAQSESRVVILNSWYHKLVARYKMKRVSPTTVEFMTNYLPEPDLVFYLDVPPEVAVDRRENFSPVECGVYDGYSHSKKGYVAYQKRVNEELRRMAERNNWRRVPLGSQQDMIDEVYATIDKLINAQPVR